MAGPRRGERQRSGGSFAVVLGVASVACAVLGSLLVPLLAAMPLDPWFLAWVPDLSSLPGVAGPARAWAVVQDAVAAALPAAPRLPWRVTRAEAGLLFGLLPLAAWTLHLRAEARRRLRLLRSEGAVLAEIARGQQAPSPAAREASAFLAARGVTSDPTASAAPGRRAAPSFAEAEDEAARLLAHLARRRDLR